MNQRDGLKRSDRLAQLLREAEAPEVLPWSRAVAIVESAPAARAPFFSLPRLAQPMRLAGGFAAALVLATGTLAVIPAQADHVGTIISTQLPSAWTASSEQMAEFKREANRQFGELGLPGSQLYVLNVAEANGRPELAVVIQNVETSQARAFYAGLADKYPALDSESFEPRVEDIEGESPGSVLSTVVAGMLQPAQLRGLSEAEARVHVLKALSGMGLTPTEVRTSRRADGTLVIEIDAQMEVPVQGHMQDDLGPMFEELLKAAE
jgi:hypothetical protein